MGPRAKIARNSRIGLVGSVHRLAPVQFVEEGMHRIHVDARHVEVTQQVASGFDRQSDDSCSVHSHDGPVVLFSYCEAISMAL